MNILTFSKNYSILSPTLHFLTQQMKMYKQENARQIQNTTTTTPSAKVPPRPGRKVRVIESSSSSEEGDDDNGSDASSNSDASDSEEEATPKPNRRPKKTIAATTNVDQSENATGLNWGGDVKDSNRKSAEKSNEKINASKDPSPGLGSKFLQRFGGATTNGNVNNLSINTEESDMVRCIIVVSLYTRL